MNYIKSRIDVREAAKKRLAETKVVMEEANKALDPVMVQYDIPTPQALIERLDSNELARLKDEDSEEIKRLIVTLSRYTRAEAASKEFAMVVEHIADFGENATAEYHGPYPIDWHYVELSESQVSWFFEPYEAVEDSPNYYGERAMLKGAQHQRGLGRLHALLNQREAVGMSTVLGRG